jgi:hypothetical protein
LASWSKESIEIDDAPVLSCVLLWYGREQHVPPVQGVTHHELEVHQEDDPVKVVAVVVLGKALQEDAALAMIAGAPGFEPSPDGDERVGEVGGVGDGAGEQCGRVGWLCGVEAILPFGNEADEGRRVDGFEAAKEATFSDDAAERAASGGDAGEIGRGRQAEEDLLEELVGEGRKLRRP